MALSSKPWRHGSTTARWPTSTTPRWTCAWPTDPGSSSKAPIPDGQAHERGVVAEGPVGARWAGRLRIFRYEVRLWQDGVIPDVAEAVESPQRLTRDPDTAERVCECVRELPTPVWGRDELGAGEMWNSNSVIAWVIARSGRRGDPAARRRQGSRMAGGVEASRRGIRSFAQGRA
jgi:hypothetical protein